jgi:hypothetical protein
LTKNQAIRAYCLDCMCGQALEVRLCPSRTCVLHPFRMGTEELENRSNSDRINRTRAIAKKCRECTGEAVCDFTGCPLREHLKKYK